MIIITIIIIIIIIILKILMIPLFPIVYIFAPLSIKIIAHSIEPKLLLSLLLLI